MDDNTFSTGGKRAITHSNNLGPSRLSDENRATVDSFGPRNGMRRAPTIALPQIDHVQETLDQEVSANTYPLPNSITVTVASAAGAGAVATRVYLLNNATLNNITNNGSGAASIVNTFQDGFAGNVVSALLVNARAGMGAICYGVATRMTVTATGAGNPAGLAAANPNFLSFNALGNSIPLNFNVTSDQTRKDFDTSIEVIPCVINVAAFVQYSFVVPVANTATITFYFTKNFTR